jgi:prepilin-type N-terminal cleavage/methylation domain-containing protein
MKTRTSAGFSLIELIIVVVVIGIVILLGVVGYSRWQENRATKVDTAVQTDSAASVPAVNSTKDLDTAADALDKTDLTTDNSSDTSQLGGQASAF